MPNFKDISQFTLTEASPDHEIQVSALNKITLGSIAKILDLNQMFKDGGFTPIRPYFSASGVSSGDSLLQAIEKMMAYSSNGDIKFIRGKVQGRSLAGIYYTEGTLLNGLLFDITSAQLQVCVLNSPIDISSYTTDDELLVGWYMTSVKLDLSGATGKQDKPLSINYSLTTNDPIIPININGNATYFLSKDSSFTLTGTKNIALDAQKFNERGKESALLVISTEYFTEPIGLYFSSTVPIYTGPGFTSGTVTIPKAPDSGSSVVCIAIQYIPSKGIFLINTLEYRNE